MPLAGRCMEGNTGFHGLQQCAGLMPDEWMSVRLCVFKHAVLDGENVTEFLMHLKA